jgi:hypothetical protein
MSRDMSMANKDQKQDIKWSELIEYSQSEIRACQKRINRLRKSLKFFTEQAKSGIPFPSPKNTRHHEIS